MDDLPAPIAEIKPFKGFVYFIGPDWDFGRVKIGHTRASVSSRLAALQTGCPFPLKIYAFVEGDKQLERTFHETFAPLRTQGEWFSLRHKLESLVVYFENSGLENRAITDDEWDAAMHDVMQCDSPPHPSVDPEEWIDSADAGVLSAWECERAWEIIRATPGAYQ